MCVYKTQGKEIFSSHRDVVLDGLRPFFDLPLVYFLDSFLEVMGLCASWVCLEILILSHMQHE